MAAAQLQAALGLLGPETKICDLSNHHISDFSDVLFHLRKAKQVRELQLGNCKISNINALSVYLKYAKNLERLYLQHNPIGNEGAKVLAEGLVKNPSLQLLNLSGCQLGDDGLTELCAILPQTQIRKLYLYNNQISNAGAKALMDCLDHLTEVFVWDNAMDEEHLEDLAHAALKAKTQLVTGLKNRKLEKSAVKTKRNFRVPQDKTKEPVVLRETQNFGVLRAKAEQLGS